MTPFRASKMSPEFLSKMERIKSIKNIGKLEGKILVFGGVYSNFQSLKKMIQIADELKIPSKNIICTGDVVGYCAEPEKTVQKVIDWGIHCIAGNVEIQLAEGLEDCGCDFRSGSRCDVFSRQWYPFAKSVLSQHSINWMKELPDFIEFEFGNEKGLVVHGSYFETSDYVFKSTNWEKKQANFEVTNSNLILAGHCGLPFSDFQNDQNWLNPGVIGMPANDGTTRVWYMILENNQNGKLVFQHQSFEYDFEKAANLMSQNQLPPEYALTLKTGLWDNCEILPAEETKAQGVKITLN